VTGARRIENLKEVPLSISAMKGEAIETVTVSGQDIRAISGRVPSLNVESDFGRSFPRFYVRGLGNTDFDLNASQPVGLVFDDVVQENPILKGFPLFDIEQVELLRGPQGTLFGRNSPAGVMKFDSVKPGKRFEGYASLGLGAGMRRTWRRR
jgi:iron complex outermembrane receptor protein